MSLLIFLLAINLFKLFISPYFPLIGDEGYYWLWGLHPDLNYVDHPPMAGYLYWLIGQLFGPSELAIRSAAIVLVLLISGVIYLTAKELAGRPAAKIAVITFNLLPLFFGGGLFLVPHTIFFFFNALTLYFLVRLDKSRNPFYWYPVGLFCGLTLLSDFYIIFVLFGLALYLLLNKENRFWLKTKELYLGAIAAALVASPMLYWNIIHNFPSLSYHSNRPTPDIFGNLLFNIVFQSLMYTPIIFGAAYSRVWAFLSGKEHNLFNALTSGVFLPFAIFGSLTQLGAHWPSATYLPSIIETAKIKRWAFNTLLFFALLVNGLAFVYYIFLF